MVYIAYRSGWAKGCTDSQSTMAKMIGVSRRSTVSTHLKKLVEQGHLVKMGGKKEQGASYFPTFCYGAESEANPSLSRTPPVTEAYTTRHSRVQVPTKNLIKNKGINPPNPPGDGDGDCVSFQPSAGDRGYPYQPQDSVTDTDLKVSTPSTNGKSSIPLADLFKMGLCRECRGPLNGSRRTHCQPCWENYKQAQKGHEAEWAGMFPNDGRTVTL